MSECYDYIPESKLGLVCLKRTNLGSLVQSNRQNSKFEIFDKETNGKRCLKVSKVVVNLLTEIITVEYIAQEYKMLQVYKLFHGVLKVYE